MLFEKCEFFLKVQFFLFADFSKRKVGICGLCADEHTTQKDYGKDETSEERREMKNIIYNDSYNDAKDDERYADACLVARTYTKVFRKVVNPSTLLYVKDNFRNRYSNVFRKFQQGNVCTLEDVGILEDVTRERIRQIEAKAFRKIRVKEKNKSLSLKGYISTD